MFAAHFFHRDEKKFAAILRDCAALRGRGRDAQRVIVLRCTAQRRAKRARRGERNAHACAPKHGVHAETLEKYGSSSDQADCAAVSCAVILVARNASAK